eukprot:119670_1
MPQSHYFTYRRILVDMTSAICTKIILQIQHELVLHPSYSMFNTTKTKPNATTKTKTNATPLPSHHAANDASKPIAPAAVAYLRLKQHKCFYCYHSLSHCSSGKC